MKIPIMYEQKFGWRIMDNLLDSPNFLTAKPSRYAVKQYHHASFKVAMKASLYSKACKSKLCIKSTNPWSLVDAKQ